MPKVSDDYLGNKREIILDASVTCFARKGFSETTIEDICSEASISHGAVYRYFRNKQDIIEASFRREEENRASRYSTVFKREDARNVLKDYLSIYFQRRAEPEDETTMKFHMQIYGESVRNPRMGEVLRQSREETLKKSSRIIRLDQERGEINPNLDAIAVARILLALADGFYIQRSTTQDMDVESCRKAFEALFLGNFWTEHEGEANHGKYQNQIRSETK